MGQLAPGSAKQEQGRVDEGVLVPTIQHPHALSSGYAALRDCLEPEGGGAAARRGRGYEVEVLEASTPSSSEPGPQS